MPRIGDAILWLAICFLLAFTFAITWVIIMTLTLPPTDGAYGQAPFEDPLVFPIMSIYASIAAIVVFPITYSVLRDRPFLPATLILAAVVLVEIVVITPFHAPTGFLLSFLAYGIGLAVARWLSGAHQRDSSRRGIRFGLRTLLWVITIAAVILGLIMWYKRMPREGQLLTAAYEGDLAEVESLLARHVSVHSRDTWDTTPLMLAAGWGHLDIVKLLLVKGAPINERSRFNRTALMWAAASGQDGTVRYLVSQGANVSLVDIDGKSAAQLAADNGFQAIAEYLQSHPSEPEKSQKRLP